MKIVSGSIISISVSDRVSKALEHVAKAECTNRLAWVQALITKELERLGYVLHAGKSQR
jgi:hypothetical protein